MSPLSEIEARCVEVLNTILRTLSEARPASVDVLRDMVKELVAHSFDVTDLTNEIDAVQGVVRSYFDGDSNLILEFSDLSGYPHRAEFFKKDSYRLASLKFQCPSCFGEGVVDNEKCILCGGLGWGTN